MHLGIENGSQGSCEVFKPRATSKQDMTSQIRICFEQDAGEEGGVSGLGEKMS